MQAVEFLELTLTVAKPGPGVLRSKRKRVKSFRRRIWWLMFWLKLQQRRFNCSSPVSSEPWSWRCRARCRSCTWTTTWASGCPQTRSGDREPWKWKLYIVTERPKRRSTERTNCTLICLVPIWWILISRSGEEKLTSIQLFELLSLKDAFLICPRWQLETKTSRERPFRRSFKIRSNCFERAEPLEGNWVGSTFTSIRWSWSRCRAGKELTRRRHLASGPSGLRAWNQTRIKLSKGYSIAQR